jgi:rhamnosyltransferase
MLKALRECCSTVYLVCNYPEATDGLQYVQSYVDKIYYRENIGFDAGAYKDALIDYIGWEQLRAYDELVLANDSFFGPFYPLQDFFKMMSDTNCDFWGMSGSGPGQFQNPLYNFDAYIHSYFFVFRNRVLCSDAFEKFWIDLRYPLSFQDAIVDFEHGINICLKKNGFRGSSHADCWNVVFSWNENPYCLYQFEMVKEKKFPVLKKKHLLIRNPGFESALKTILYIKEENLYPVEWITETLENQFFLGQGQETNSLESFYRKYEKIYIYGKGVCGNNLATYFDFKDWKFAGFILTDVVKDKDQNQIVLSMDEAVITENTGIIISVLNPKIANEIVSNIGDRCSKEQLFLVSECKAIALPK